MSESRNSTNSTNERDSKRKSGHKHNPCGRRKKHKKPNQDEEERKAKGLPPKKKEKTECYETLKARLMAELHFGDPKEFTKKLHKAVEDDGEQIKRTKKRKNKSGFREARYFDLCGDPCPKMVRVFPPFCRTTTTGSVIVPDIAVDWYKRELDKKNGNTFKEVSYYSPIGTACYPLGERKSMKAPIRLVPRKTFNENSFIKISPEFLAILKRHEDWLLGKYPEYGLPLAYIKTKGPMTLYEGYKMPPSERPPIDPDCNCGPLMNMDDFAVKKDQEFCYPHKQGRPQS